MNLGECSFMTILAVIPARGNSKGIPRKNMRLMNGKPLIYYSIQTAKMCNAITHIVVSSDNAEILDYAQELDVFALKRDDSLSGDDITLDPVICDAVEKMESKVSHRFDYVITMQPTSPNLIASTLNIAVEKAIETKVDTMISAINKPSLSWRKKGDSFTPNYTERLNRQLLPSNFVEAGAFVISKRAVVTRKSRIGSSVSVFELSEHEGIDIDTIEEWVLSDALMRRKKIAFRTDGNRHLGMGHIYRCLTLAYALTEHEIIFISHKNFAVGVKKIEESFFTCHQVEDISDFHAILKQEKPDILVMDVLDTEEDEMFMLKKFVNRLITFEDMGTGTNVADAVINSLFTNKDNRPHVYTGYKFADLRDEFLLKEPKDFSSHVNNIFVMFGGADPANLTKKVYNVVCENIAIFRGITFNFVIGLAFDSTENKIIERPNDGIFVYNNTNKVSWFMQQADLAITSQGRSTFELASLAVPSVVMAQNEREKTHSFAALESGFLNLGFGLDVTEETLFNTLVWLVGTPQVRKEMREIMLHLDLRKGINRVKRIILDEVV